MKKFTAIFITCILVLTVLAVGCAAAPAATDTGKPATSQKVWNITYSHQHPPDQANQVQVKNPWIRMMEQKSGGRLVFTVAPASTLAAPPDQLDSAKKGLAEMANQALAFIPGRFPLNEVTALPMLFKFPGSRNLALTHKALMNKYPELSKEWEKEGIKLLGVSATGPQHVHTTKKPVHTMADLKGLVMIAGGAIGSQTGKILGSTPENLGPPDFYDSLSKGVVNGIFLEWEGLQTFKLGEVINYSTEVGLWVNGVFDVMNLNTWNSLPPDLQQLFMDTQAIEQEYECMVFDAKDKADKEILQSQLKKKGQPEIYILPDTERAKWIEAVMPIREAWVKNVVSKGLLNESKARAMLDDTIKFADQYSFEKSPLCTDCEKTVKGWQGLPKSIKGY